jgi:tRNA A-37 threonylcarbamoyl transferase component Bud32
MKEGAYPEAEHSESIEREPAFSKEAIEKFLKSRKVITDSGANGIIFRIGPEELSPEDRERMTFENEDNPEGALSIKVLKVFNLEKARHEFESLREAGDIILEKSASSSAPLFRIPRAIGFEEIEVDEETEKFLNTQKALIVNGKVGVITMDWIEGKNLGVYLHEELLKRTSDQEDPQEAVSWDNRDFTKMLRTLEKKGYVFPEEMLSQIKNGVQALHEGRLWHNDLHFGNFIVTPNGQIYAIDFADATHEKINIEEDEGLYHLSDENIIRSLESLAKTPETKERERNGMMLKEWDERIAIIEKQPQAEAQYQSFKKALEANDMHLLEGALIGASGSDHDLDTYLGNLLRLSRENGEYHDRIKEFLSERLGDRKNKMRSFVTNRIHAVQKAIEI